MDKEKKLISYLNSKKNIIIYGAGMVGGLVKSRLAWNHLDNKISCFMKSSASESEMYMGIKVLGLDILEDLDTDTCILVCALSATQKEMVHELEKRGVRAYIVISEALFLDLQEHYMADQRMLNQGMVSEHFDVIFFSQDNNSTSGAFISMVGLCDEIQKLEKLTILVVLPRYGDGEKLLKKCGLEYTYVNRETEWIQAIGNQAADSKEKHSLYHGKEIEELRRLIRNTGAGLVHMSGMFVFAGAIAAREEKIPVIWHIRENIATQGNCFRNEEDSYRLLNASQAVVCVSRHVRQAYPKLEKDIVRIIYNGADASKFYTKREIFNSSRCRIVMVGHITRLKGQEVLIRALEYLKNEGASLPYVTFVGGGESNYLDDLEKIIVRAGVEKDIDFVGRTMEPEIYYRQSDIAISATNGGEGFDRVRIEAMLSGCLLIANDIGAAREIVREGETGYLYENGNAKALAEKIMEAAENIGRSRAIAVNGQRLCMERFTKRHNAEQVLALYREVTGIDYGRKPDISARF